ncbi:alpha/beta hydrolase fold protein [Methyloglobulus morosus KoM1]|uniref:Alpha/beta hydrolase fold protein n=1 Tax=Methyloglobulus morosus KoM1 TaxID=1116472 RepID=V5E334_9GAMM|nr:alpha/beta fold hydrolase [Methyloglobulus morosus]ESS73971.1 alpha/beta hydrolase fold protein [Methyloglobulus morosus KoM1]
MPKILQVSFSLMETVALAYEELGRNNPVPLIILHGFFASSRNWRKIAERLSATYRVYVLDIRNHGSSPHHPEMDYPTMTADVLRFMDEHQLAIAHILGHSMGGKIAMWLALNHPERLGKLIVVDIAPKSYTHRFDNIIQAMIDLPLAEIQNRKQAETLLAESIPELGYRQFLLQNLVLKDGHYCWRVDLNIFMRTASNIAAFPGTQSLLPFSGETAFIAGADSNYLESKDTLHLFPDATFTTIANTGHWIHAQQPEVFIEVVENFLQNG